MPFHDCFSEQEPWKLIYNTNGDGLKKLQKLGGKTCQPYRDYLFYWKMFENTKNIHRKKEVRSPHAQTTPKSGHVSWRAQAPGPNSLYAKEGRPFGVMVLYQVLEITT